LSFIFKGFTELKIFQTDGLIFLAHFAVVQGQKALMYLFKTALN